MKTYEELGLEPSGKGEGDRVVFQDAVFRGQTDWRGTRVVKSGPMNTTLAYAAGPRQIVPTRTVRECYCPVDRQEVRDGDD